MTEITSKINLVFVYGSLKKGKNNHRFMGNSKFIGQAYMEGAELYDVGAFPALKFVDDTSLLVQGELYEVTEKTLKTLDILEGHPDYYRRYFCTCLMDNKSIPCYVYEYAYPLDKKPRLGRANW